MKYNPKQIEARWQKYWADHKPFAAQNPPFNNDQPTTHNQKPKYYVLDMFPYPSGAGLHVGHPLGYIASDIVARYKRHKGFNVLHPQGYDSFGLPAEQYAIQTGQHPEKTTRENIARYREQLDRIGFSFDWDREIRTSDPNYYKHTQWIFIQLFESWYNKNTDRAENISTLITHFENHGNEAVNAVCDDNITPFSAEQWTNFSSEEKQKILLQYRLTYLAETEVNWCPALGTVLANDEIVNGVSERGGHPIIRKKMTQWSMRISAYAERLLQGLDTIDWSESIKESQRNWIGKSVGATITFPILSFPKGEEKAKFTGSAGYMTGGNYSFLNIHHAIENRKNPTASEKLLWEQLRGKKLVDKFRQQHLIDNYIVDFVCLSKKLVIEVDGGYHTTDEQIHYDAERTVVLNNLGFKVIRFTNNEVLTHIDVVLNTIKSELKSSNTMHASAPSPAGRVGVGIFTTRPDTLFGVTFCTLAPEHPLVLDITTDEQKIEVDAYILKTAKRSERERMADVKTISGVFTGAYVEHPFTKEAIPVWIGDYVLAGYGTGAVMAVPCGDERDFAFANFFKNQNGMPEIKNIFNQDISEKAFTEKTGFELTDSDFLNGMNYKQATKKVIEALEKIGAGKGKTNYRLRDAVFSRQRYWGEPFPVYYVNGLPQMIDAKHLPIKLPEVEKYLPTEDGQPPLGNATVWAWNVEKLLVVGCDLIDHAKVFPLELNTMPGWAGSSWYWMRYMDVSNENEIASKEAIKYWDGVDLYIGGSEHATGHLLYSRFWNKFLKDIGFAPTEEPFKKLIDQGMILGMSAFVYQIFPSVTIKKMIDFGNMAMIKNSKFLVSKKIFTECQNENYENLKAVINQIIKDYAEQGFVVEWNYEKTVINPIHVDLSLINQITNELNLEAFKKHPLYSEYATADFILEDNKYIVGREVEKMSKSKYNVVNPDEICNEYGADTLRLYEMFLGPLEQSKPWNTAGISGVFGFLKKLWRLFYEDEKWVVTAHEASKEALKSLHKTIKKTTEDIENFSFNTSVSQFMICVNELSAINCHERKILEPLTILISPYAPHIAEELWFLLQDSKIDKSNNNITLKGISEVPFPIFDPKYLVETDKEYPVSFNGKMRFTISLPLDLAIAEIEDIVLKDERTIIQLAGSTPKKVIIVPGKVINMVVG